MTAETRCSQECETSGPLSRSSKLTPKQERFISEYLVDLNSAAAARRAGYSEKTAAAIGFELLMKPEITAELARCRRRQSEAAELRAVRVLQELRRLALSDIGAFFDEHGNFRPVTQWTEEMRSQVASFKVVKNGNVEIYKIRFWDKLRALETLAKHLGLLQGKVEHSGELKIRWQTAEEANRG